jgi:hypothetical protein
VVASPASTTNGNSLLNQADVSVVFPLHFHGWGQSRHWNPSRYLLIRILIATADTERENENENLDVLTISLAVIAGALVVLVVLERSVASFLRLWEKMRCCGEHFFSGRGAGGTLEMT